MESFLDGLTSEGFSDEGAVGGYRAFTSFLFGHLLLEVANLGADVGPLDVVDDGSPDYGNLEPYPAVRRMRKALAEDHAADRVRGVSGELARPDGPDPCGGRRPAAGAQTLSITDEPWPNRPWLAVIPTLAPSTWRPSA